MPRSNLCKSDIDIACERLIRRIRGEVLASDATLGEIAKEAGLKTPAVSRNLKNGSYNIRTLLACIHKAGISAEEIGELMTY